MALRVVTFKIDSDILEEIDKYALDNRLFRSDVIRMALVKFLEEVKKQKGNEGEMPSIKVEKIEI